MIELKNIHKSFGHNHVLKGIDLSVLDGEVVVILGPSGSGKTTLLRCIDFLERADEGEITVGDTHVNIRHAKKQQTLALVRKTAMVFQQYNLFKNKTALEHVIEGLIVVQKVEKQEALERGRNLLENVGLGDKFDAYPSQLSGGQQQRVGIARALILNPEVILFDEPLVDEIQIQARVRSVNLVAHQGMTMIVVTHEIDFAVDVATKVVFMDAGQIVEQGLPEEVISHPKEERTRQFLRRLLPESSYSI